MQIEATLSTTDLVEVLDQFIPARMPLGGEGDLFVTAATDVTLIPDVGLRAALKAKLHWPVLGISVPATLNSLVVILRPGLSKESDGGKLAFKVEVEHIDLAGLPALIDDRITEKVNQALAEKHVELSWNFTRTLSHAFKLPQTLAPLEAFELIVSGAQMKVTEKAMVLTVSFRSSVARSADPV